MNVSNNDCDDNSQEQLSNSSETESLNNVEHSSPMRVNILDNIDLELGDIHEENNLINYTDTHFTNVSNANLHQLRAEYANTSNNCNEIIRQNVNRCDSPMTISNYGSRSGSSNNSDVEEESSRTLRLNKPISLDDIAHKIIPTIVNHSNHDNKPRANNKHRNRNSFKKLAYNEAERTLDKYYDTELNNKYSSHLDILTTYMRGQKNIYIQSNQLSNWRHNCLMFPTFFITCGVTIFTDFVKCDSENKWIITALNATIAMLVALMHYLKLESSSTLFLQLANHYDKFEISLEMTNTKLVLLESENEKRALVLNQINNIEEKLNDLKEVNNTLIPVEIKQIFPIICHVNIFSFIKKLENHRNTLILKFKDIQNEIRFILHKWENEENNFTMESLNAIMIQRKTNDKQREQNRLDYLYKMKDNLKHELNDYRTAYSSMDDIFTAEIKQAERETNRLGIWFLCLWKHCFHPVHIQSNNPVLDKYFHFLFNDK